MFLLGLDLVSSSIVLVFSLCELNGMGLHSSHSLRAAFVLMAVGAFGTISSLVCPDSDVIWAHVAMVSGIALYMLAHRRHEVAALIRAWWLSISSFPRVR